MSWARRSPMVAVMVAACATPAIAPGPSPIAPITYERWSDAWLAREGQRFIDDTDQRRAALASSLTNHENLYSRQRLGAYALGSRGWDLLPVWNPRSQIVDADLATQLERGEVPTLAEGRGLWDGARPATQEAWIALGRRVFFELPLRSEVFMEFALTRPELARAVGVERTASGEIPGLALFRDVDGQTRVGITCAICHSSVKDGAVIAGRARRSFDYGRLRVAYFAATGEPVDADQVRRMSSWGPGRADVTEDDDEDPVAIPDLWGLRAQSWLTQAGTIRHDGPLALAVRQESQLIDAGYQRIRPERALVWALTMYLYSLSPPARSRVAVEPRGAALFEQRCASCHANAAYGGGAIEAAQIGTDPSLAHGRGRGTGRYRVPPLLAVADGAPYLHDGTVMSLDELLSPERRAPGHRAGTDLSPEDRAVLIAFLQTL